MFPLVLNQHLSVFRPCFYSNHKVKVAASLSIVTWLIAAINNAILFPGLLDCLAFDTFKWVCSRSSSCSASCSNRFRITFIISVLRATSPVSMYARLFYKARQIRKEECTRDSEGAAARDLHRRDHETTVTFLLFIAVYICTLPNTIFVIAVEPISSRLGGELPAALYVVGVCTYTVLSLLAIIDPLLLMRNQDLRMILASINGSAIEKWCPCRTIAVHKGNALCEVIANPAAVV